MANPNGSPQNLMYQPKRHALCWDCANACGGCNWSNELKPVDGWEIEYGGVGRRQGAYVVSCPEFIRDARSFGLKRL